MPWKCVRCRKMLYGHAANTAQLAENGGKCCGCVNKKTAPKIKKRCPECGREFQYTARRGGLCWKCGLTPEIREKYPRADNRVNTSREPQDRRPERKPLDGFYRCLWCLKWVCDAPLQKCEACWLEYHTSTVDMPPAPEIDAMNNWKDGYGEEDSSGG